MKIYAKNKKIIKIMTIRIGNGIVGILVLFYLVSQTTAIKHFRLTTSASYTLSSTSSSKLFIDDFLYSTLGIFRISLQENNCLMKV